jgi:hypothetical protein
MVEAMGSGVWLVGEKKRKKNWELERNLKKKKK